MSKSGLNVLCCECLVFGATPTPPPIYLPCPTITCLPCYYPRVINELAVVVNEGGVGAGVIYNHTERVCMSPLYPVCVCVRAHYIVCTVLRVLYRIWLFTEVFNFIYIYIYINHTYNSYMSIYLSCINICTSVYSI